MSRPFRDAWRSRRSRPGKNSPEITVLASTTTRVVAPPDPLLGFLDDGLEALAGEAQLFPTPVEHLEHPVQVVLREEADPATVVHEEQTGALPNALHGRRC